MKPEEMFKAINKGVPNFIIMPIHIPTIIKECSSNQEQLQQEFKLIGQLFRDAIININAYSKAKEDFMTELRIITDYGNSLTRIYISATPYLIRLKQLLNCNNPSTDFNDEQLKQDLLAKVEELKKIATPEELKSKFPEIYKDYELSITAYNQIRNYERIHLRCNDHTTKQVVERQDYLYRAYALDRDFKRFIEKQSIMYRNNIVRRQFVDGYANRHPLDLRMFEGLDKAKFELYLADKYLTRAYETDSDYEKQACVFYLCTYIRETMSSDVSIKNERGEQVTFRKLLQRYKKLLKDNKTLKPIDEDRSNFDGYHVKHVENHVKKYFITGVNWQIIPTGFDESELDERIIESLNRTYNYLSLDEKEKQIKERFATYKRKMQFFENTGYVHRVYGTNSFDGYIAFIYPNGEVIMEKFFDDHARCLPTVNEAIYNVNVKDFEALSSIKKTKLIKEGKCTRIIHRGNWEAKGQEIINRPSTPETEEEVRKLIKRLNEPICQV